MIDRRAFTLSLGALAATTAASRSQAAETPTVFSDPGKGPWTGDHYLQRAGGRLHYATLGDEKSPLPPVVLLHKLGGWIADWRHVAPALAEGRQVIAFDLPGHGESQWGEKAPYIQSLGETAALLVGAFDELGLDRVDLVGTSLGGCVAVPLAAHFPERIHRLALVSSALVRKHTLAEIAVQIDKGEADAKLFDADGNPVLDTNKFPNIMNLAHPGPINAEQNASRRRAGHWIQPSERGVFNADIVGMLHRIEARTLLLYGARPNPYVTFRSEAEAALRNSRTEFVPDAGAFVMQDNPPATSKALRNFLENG